jgi:hypothetical protein
VQNLFIIQETKLGGMRSSMIVDPEGNLIEIGSDFWE